MKVALHFAYRLGNKLHPNEHMPSNSIAASNCADTAWWWPSNFEGTCWDVRCTWVTAATVPGTDGG